MNSGVSMCGGEQEGVRARVIAGRHLLAACSAIPIENRFT
jgi:hypothetical protein